MRLLPYSRRFLRTINRSATRPDPLHSVHRHDVGRARARDRRELEHGHYRLEAGAALRACRAETAPIRAYERSRRRGLAHVTAEVFGGALTTHFNPVMYGPGRKVFMGLLRTLPDPDGPAPVSYTHLTLPTKA